MSDPRDLILEPVVSEKSYDLIEQYNTYTFLVDRRATKDQIRHAMERIFEVRVVKVNTLIRRGKRKRTRWVMGRRSDIKRAMVTLAPGDSVDVFGV